MENRDVKNVKKNGIEIDKLQKIGGQQTVKKYTREFFVQEGKKGGRPKKNDKTGKH